MIDIKQKFYNRNLSLEEVLNRAEEIKQNKRRETLLANIENAKISKQLVELKQDVKVEKNIEDYYLWGRLPPKAALALPLGELAKICDF